jgi:hypothetical protein
MLLEQGVATRRNHTLTLPASLCPAMRPRHYGDVSIEGQLFVLGMMHVVHCYIPFCHYAPS